MRWQLLKSNRGLIDLCPVRGWFCLSDRYQRRLAETPRSQMSRMASHQIFLSGLVTFLLTAPVVIAVQLPQSKKETEGALGGLRSLLQGTNPLCTWDAGSSACFADYARNIPDQDLIAEAQLGEVCHSFPTQQACESKRECLWFFQSCILDVPTLHGRCFDPAWNIFKRGLDCGLLGSSTKCTSLPGCLWDATSATCVPDEAARNQAQASNPILQQDIAAQATCASNTAPGTCIQPCVSLGPSCLYPPLFSDARYILPSETSTYCQFTQQTVQCEAKAPADCDADPSCLSTPGHCVLASEVVVKITYAAFPALQQRMLAALTACPTFTTQADCLAFL